MKKIWFSLIVIVMVMGCAGQKRLATVPDENLTIEENDQDEYELIIIDPGFDSWFITHAKPAEFYSLSYYESKNRIYVTSWNELFYQYGGGSPFENRIDYDFHTDYGLELNYKLFWYFKYVESKFGKYYGFPA